MGGRAPRLLSGLTALLCALTTLPASAQTSMIGLPPIQKRPTDLRETQRRNFLNFFKEEGAPEGMIEFLSNDQSVDTDTWVWPMPTDDLNGDGRDDVLELHITFSYGLADSQSPLGLREQVETSLKVRSGGDGSLLWKRRWEDFVYPLVMRVGDEGRMGVVALKGWYNFFSIAVEAYQAPFSFEALNGRKGHTLWTRGYQSTHVGDYQASVDENVMVSIDIFQGVAGPADDLVLGLGTVTSVMFEELIVATKTVVLDGDDGDELVHPLVDVGIAWIPYPTGVGDLDDDGLDDYLVTNNIGVDPGDGQETPSTGGTLYARRSTDGSAVWTASGMAFYDFAYTGGLPHVTGGSRPEVFLFTPEDLTPLIPIDNSIGLLPQSYTYGRFQVFLFDGDTGVQRWVRYADGIWSPGDVDGDGVSDIALGEGDSDAETLSVTYRRWNITGENRLIWKRRIRWSLDGVPCPNGACAFNSWWGSELVGDVQPDGPREDLVYTYAEQEPNIAMDVRQYLLDARTGEIMLRGGGELSSANGSFDLHGADLVDLRVDQGGVHLKGLDGRDGSLLWRLGYQLPGDVLPRQVSAWPAGIDATRDRCSDLYIEIGLRTGLYYAIIDGGNGKVVWSKWFPERADMPGGQPPRPLARVDSNPAC